MVTILHGDDNVASRKAFLELRRSINPNSVIEFNDGNLVDFVRVADGPDLFALKKLIIVEIYKQQVLKGIPYLSYLQGKPATTEVIFWVASALPSQSELLKVGQANGWRIILFEGFNRNHVFKFIDSIFEHREREALLSLSPLLEGGENFFGIFSLIIQRVRLLLWDRFSVSSLKKISPFVRSKVRKQGQSFSDDQLIKILSECQHLDTDLKTGAIDPVFAIIKVLETVR